MVLPRAGDESDIIVEAEEAMVTQSDKRPISTILIVIGNLYLPHMFMLVHLWVFVLFFSHMNMCMYILLYNILGFRLLMPFWMWVLINSYAD